MCEDFGIRTESHAHTHPGARLTSFLFRPAALIDTTLLDALLALPQRSLLLAAGLLEANAGLEWILSMLKNHYKTTKLH